ncbi:hypothetical protein LOTGIDRAFT_157149 [Lottia gigantea]|uniref:Uncharacterized protein n=1 Tax=Lottia gigantea TaxID=225164 RepID=V4B8E9_LOTGI|nr:hypothetical protein LOTGIDRAFT_157149 [Lottia gigantea]ESP02017.1 hypothetical protein LOTGIDRAFT_157149 [Lottia gigantea]
MDFDGIIRLGREIGLEGEELTNFVAEERALIREERVRDRESRVAEREFVLRQLEIKETLVDKEIMLENLKQQTLESSLSTSDLESRKKTNHEMKNCILLNNIRSNAASVSIDSERNGNKVVGNSNQQKYRDVKQKPKCDFNNSVNACVSDDGIDKDEISYLSASCKRALAYNCSMPIP